ncbi:MAG TPA: tetratricopeptide repeat protein [Vicinamibacteria bacterium]|nr:tetratricopeptide repeat protein [Vicinamibacteria bacterium]
MKRFLLTAGLLAALALVGAPASAQTGTARGKVVDDKGQPVADAAVLLEFQGGVTRKLDTKTNKKGEFTQVGVYPGVYRVTASKEGYQSALVEQKIALGEATYLPDIKLTPKSGVAGSAVSREELGAAFKKATELTAAGQWDAAEAAFKEMLAKTPSIPEVHYNLGYVASEKKDWAAAEAAYLKAIELRPNYGEAYVALAKVHQDQGNAAKATEVMAQAAAAAGDDAKVQFNLGVFFLNAGKSAEAAAAFQKAAELDPANPEPHFHLGTILVGQNKLPEAIASLEKYLAMSPQNPQSVATAQGLLGYLKPKK